MIHVILEGILWVTAAFALAIAVGVNFALRRKCPEIWGAMQELAGRLEALEGGAEAQRKDMAVELERLEARFNILRTEAEAILEKMRAQEGRLDAKIGRDRRRAREVEELEEGAELTPAQFAELVRSNGDGGEPAEESIEMRMFRLRHGGKA